jgi:N-acetylneuraminic acid mutarotase
MIVWGGQELGHQFLADGAAYDPTTDAWRRIAPSPLSPRSGQAAVWTGEEMIIWGGEGGEESIQGPDPVPPLADGASYDPVTDSWRSIAPSPLSTGAGSTVVWAGGEMLVWGGHTDVGQATGAVSEGAAYDAVGDRWRVLPPAPISARVGALSVWTGRELVVWGGRTADEHKLALTDGAAYSPEKNEWRTLAPSPVAVRFGAAAVWTGDVMLVGGGSNGGGVDPPELMDEGFVYDPETDRWDATSAMGRPSVGPTVVWTGDHAIVWGGELPPDSGFTARGAAYDPSSDEWRALPRSGLRGRAFHTAVWTGSAMIVWGGFDSATLGDGAVYDLGTDAEADDVSTVAYRDGRAGFEIRYPAWWFRAEDRLTPNLADPTELISLGTFPLAHRQANCAQFPTSAIEDLGPSDVLITIWRWSSSRGHPARPTFPAGEGDPAVLHNGDESPDCLSAPKEFDRWWIGFDDRGRDYQVYVAMGPDVSEQTERQVWDILNSLTST